MKGDQERDIFAIFSHTVQHKIKAEMLCLAFLTHTHTHTHKPFDDNVCKF